MQKDWIESQYGTNYEYQKKDSKFGHLDAFKYFSETDTKTVYDFCVKALDDIIK